jgi:hypothetical protein
MLAHHKHIHKSLNYDKSLQDFGPQLQRHNGQLFLTIKGQKQQNQLAGQSYRLSAVLGGESQPKDIDWSQTVHFVVAHRIGSRSSTEPDKNFFFPWRR